MNTCNLQYLQSVAKTFMAVTILQLHEEKKIVLDAPITQYLPSRYAQYIKNAGQVTVRMLLNHTSGIAEYNSLPKYTAEVLLNPLKILDMDKALALLKDEAPQFAPGQKYQYTNTNYLLLAVIADALTGDHAAYMLKHIFQPLQMNHTYYRPGKLVNYPGITSSYWDVLSTGRPANITPMQKANVAPLKGDDGIVSTAVDAVKFIKGLMEGKLLQDSSLKLMQQWVNNAEGKPAYGMGLIYFALPGLVAYGHGGGGLGAGCVLLYIPSQKLYMFLATNTGVVIDGLGSIKAGEMRDQVLMALLQ
jgi:D-alanyl-D-alanine carboxypeptidase